MRAERGFTLIELLVSMTLLALILTMLFGGLRTGTRVWEATAARADEIARLQAVHGFLRRQIAGLYPIVERQRNRRPLSSFAGAPEHLRFVGLLPAHFGFAGFQVIEVGLTEDESGHHLGVAWHGYGGAGETPSEAQTAVLIEAVESVAFSYFGSLTRRDEPQWHPDWRDAEAAPKLVRLALTFADGDRRYWPLLVVRPAIEAVIGGRRDADDDEPD